MSTEKVSARTLTARVGRVVRRPLDRFLQLEAASSLLLIAAVVVALAWANSPWAASYDALWDTPVSLGLGSHAVDVSLHLVINDLLMAVFFFAAGLEIRRELTTGELCDRRRAALPVIAAVGGMVAPAAIYLVLDQGALARGWGIPMATDIAFAVGVLALLGNRVPSSMRVFLLALAIIDDLGSILVIAIFYSTGVQLDGLALALLGIGAIIGLQKLGAARVVTYAIPAAAIWLGLYRAGVHPTVAGVLVGLLTPARPWPGQNSETSPAERMERAAQPWVAFAIMPVFALANSGVKLELDGLVSQPALALGIALGLLVGKPAGIIGASALAVRLRIASLPRSLTWRGVAVVGVVAGIGFTMALFITELALPGAAHGTAKLVVLMASTVAALAGVALGRFVLAKEASVPVEREPRRRFIPALERGPLSFVLLVFGVICAALELTAPDRIAGRALLFIIITIAGIVGVLRRKQTGAEPPLRE
jgi:NhaA family Na+:H+ antiporter